MGVQVCTVRVAMAEAKMLCCPSERGLEAYVCSPRGNGADMVVSCGAQCITP